MTAPEINRVIPTIAQPSRTLLLLKIENGTNAASDKRFFGFHLSRSKWDPYPWVGYVETGSIADSAGLRAGDCLLDIDGTDVVGLRVKDIADLIQRAQVGNFLRLEVWRSFRNESEERAEEGIALAGPLPEVAKKLAKAVSGAVKALECPVCLESATSPVSQCVHGHILCAGCRAKTPRCPVCRVRLGQGRCLLADQIQTNIRDAFRVPDDLVPSNNSSLREKLFGKIAGKTGINEEARGDSLRVSSTKFKSSIARLLLGGFDKAASAENLSETLSDDNTKIESRPAAYRRLGELRRNDRMKSASTGELSRGDETWSATNVNRNDRAYTSTSGLLSVPNTPTWGGSTESIENPSFPCPLSRKTNCGQFVTAKFLLEHLSRSHDAPQIQFNGKIAEIPLPLPFGPDATYIFRHRGELFCFQYEDEKAWISGTGTDNQGEWSIFGKNKDNVEINLRRFVARMEDSSAPLACHSAHLPASLGIDTIVVELLDSRLGEGLEC